MSVDLPEPDGPMTATSSPRSTVKGDAAQRVDGRLALAVAAGEVRRGDDCSVCVHVAEATGSASTVRPSGSTPNRPLDGDPPHDSGEVGMIPSP